MRSLRTKMSNGKEVWEHCCKYIHGWMIMALHSTLLKHNIENQCHMVKQLATVWNTWQHLVTVHVHTYSLEYRARQCCVQ
jgi:hypothetical protein